MARKGKWIEISRGNYSFRQLERDVRIAMEAGHKIQITWMPPVGSFQLITYERRGKTK